MYLIHHSKFMLYNMHQKSFPHTTYAPPVSKFFEYGALYPAHNN